MLPDLSLPMIRLEVLTQLRLNKNTLTDALAQLALSLKK